MMTTSITATTRLPRLATASRNPAPVTEQRADSEDRGRRQQRHGHDESEQWSTHGYPFSETSSWGSRVPNRLWAWIARASSRR